MTNPEARAAMLAAHAMVAASRALDEAVEADIEENTSDPEPTGG